METKNRLAPGERMAWNSADYYNTVIVERPAPGQTWTVTWLKGGHLAKDEGGNDLRWTFGIETDAFDKARFLAQTIRDLGRA